MRLILALLLLTPVAVQAAPAEESPAVSEPEAGASESPRAWRVGIDLAGGARTITTSGTTRRTGWVAQLAVRPHVVGPLAVGLLSEVDQRVDVSGPLRVTGTRLGLAPIAELASTGPVRAVGRLGLGVSLGWTAWAPGPGTVEGAAGADVDEALLPATTVRLVPLLSLDAGVRFAPPGPVRITTLFSVEARGAHLDFGATIGLGAEL